MVTKLNLKYHKETKPDIKLKQLLHKDNWIVGTN